MTVKNQRHFFIRSVLTLALLSGTASVQAIAQLTGTFSVQSIVLLAGMTAAQTTDENGDIDMEALGLSLAELFDLEVTIASGFKQTVARAPAVTSVITAQDIEAMGATDLDEVLETVPGLHVARSPSSYNPIYSIRGIYSTFSYEVLLLINGIPLKEPFMGDRSLWGGMPVNAIARVEVIRGPGSALYGADAFSGVINIITKTRKDIDGTEFGTRMGRFNTQDAWILHGVDWNGFDVALAFEYHDTDGHDEIFEADGQGQIDKIDGTNASIAPQPANLPRRNYDVRVDISKDDWQLRTGYQGRRNIGMGGTAYSSLDPHVRFADDRFNADLTYHNPEFTKYWDITAQVNYLHINTDYPNQILFAPGRKGYPNGFNINAAWSSRQTGIEISGFYTRFNKHLLRVGIGYQYADLNKFEQSVGIPGSTFTDISDTSAAALSEKDRRSWHTFIQDSWSFLPNWELTTGIRYDEYSDFGNTTNPRMALVWQTKPNFTTKLLYGQAFRAPTFNQSNEREGNPFALGNPNLKPETIETMELAFDYRATDSLHFGLNLFTYDIEDKVLFVSESGDDTLKRAQNVGKQKGQGFELETRWKMTKKSSLLFNYSFQDSTDEADDNKVGNTPQHQAYFRTDWLLVPNWFLNTQVNWIGKRGRYLGDPREDLDGYTAVDLTLRRKNLQDPWNFAISVRNLFDEDIREPSPGPTPDGIIANPNDLPMAGRNYWLELRYKF